MTLTIAVAQIESVPGDLEANLRKHLDVIDAAQAAGVEVLVFPEMSLTGHGAGADTLRLAIRCGDQRLRGINCGDGMTVTSYDDSPLTASGGDKLLAAIADASGPMCTVFGIIEEAAAAQFHNTALAVRDGRIVFAHRKINLATYGRLDDGKHFAPGRRVESFALSPDWQASVLICADTWNPALVHLAAAQGATVLLAPVSSAREAVGAEFDNPGGWDVNLRFHALTYGMPVAMANRIGREGDLTFWGGSRIVDPFGRTLAQAAGDGEELVQATLDFDAVRRARYLLPTVREANLALVHRECERLLRADSGQSPRASQPQAVIPAPDSSIRGQAVAGIQ